jgi:hypothetical protein
MQTQQEQRTRPAVVVHARFGRYAVIHLNMAGMGSAWKVWNEQTNQGAYDARDQADALRVGRALADGAY